VAEVVCLSLLALVSFAAVVLRRRCGYLFTGWFWYLGTLVPVIGLVQVWVQSMADRYTYWPGIGIYIIVAWLAGSAAVKLKIPRSILWAASILILGVLLIMTRNQVRYWKSSMSLYERALSVTKDNYLIQSSYGDLLRKAGHIQEAMGHLRRAVEIKPTFARGHSNLALALQEKGLFDEASAEFERALELKPDSAMTHNYYGIMLAEHKLYDKAVEHFIKALRNDGHFSGVLRNLCNAGIKDGKTSEVLEVIKSWQKKLPDNPELRYWEQQLEQAQGSK
jgi:Tfp pilus assembly protein PilF